MEANNPAAHLEEEPKKSPPSKNLLDLPPKIAEAVFDNVGYRALHRLPLVHSRLKEFIEEMDFPYQIELLKIGKDGERITLTVEDKMDSLTCIYTAHGMGTRIICGTKESVVPEHDYQSLASAHLASVIKNPRTTIQRVTFKENINGEFVENLKQGVKEGSINAQEFSFEGDIGMSSDLISLINPATLKKLVFQYTSNGIFDDQPILQSPQWKAAKELEAMETYFGNNTIQNIKHFNVLYANFWMLTPQLYIELKQHFMEKADFKVAYIRYMQLRDVNAGNIPPVVGLEEYSRIRYTDDVFFFHQSAAISKFVRLHKSKVPANVTVLENW